MSQITERSDTEQGFRSTGFQSMHNTMWHYACSCAPVLAKATIRTIITMMQATHVHLGGALTKDLCRPLGYAQHRIGAALSTSQQV